MVFAADWVLLGWATFFAGGLLVTAHMLVPQWQGLCDVDSAFEPDSKSVWLTIDDGPDPEDTPQLLKLLARHDARATFFLVGERAAAHPELVEQIRAAGHEIACHTHTHPRFSFWAMGPRRLAAEIDRALPHLQSEPGEVLFFRPPVGIKNLWLGRILRARNLRCVAWTVRSGDGVGTSAQAVIARVRREVRPGAIILMHEGPSMASGVRVHAMDGVLSALSDEGYTCILPTADQLRTMPVKFSLPPQTSTKELLCN